jgi:hypothetical protein
VRPELRGDVETVLAKALAKEPGERYATAAEFAEDLRLTLEHRPIRARRPTPLYLAWKLVRRHRGLAAAAGLLVLALLGAQYVALRFVRRGEELRRSEAQRAFYLERGDRLAEREKIRSLRNEAEGFAGIEPQVETLERWRDEAERLVDRLDERRDELAHWRRPGAVPPVSPEEFAQLLEIQTDIVNDLEHMIGSRGQLPVIRALILRQREGGE